MDAETFLSLLQEHEDSDDTDSETPASDSFLHHGKIGEFKKHNEHELKGKPQEFTNKDLEKFINYVGFKTDEVPRFSEIAKRLNPKLQQPETEQNLTNLDGHDIIKDISPIRKNNENEMNVHKEAIKRILSKYRG